MRGDTPECYADCLPYLVDKTSVYLRLHGANFIQTLGIDITIDQYITLDAIASIDNICQRDLAKILLKDRSNVSRILLILEQKGLIKRVTSTKQNRPVKLLKMTPKGQKIIDNYSSVVKNDLENFWKDFDSKEVELLKNVLNKIISKISEKSNIQI